MNRKVLKLNSLSSLAKLQSHSAIRSLLFDVAALNLDQYKLIGSCNENPQVRPGSDAAPRICRT